MTLPAIALRLGSVPDRWCRVAALGPLVGSLLGCVGACDVLSDNSIEDLGKRPAWNSSWSPRPAGSGKKVSGPVSEAQMREYLPHDDRFEGVALRKVVTSFGREQSGARNRSLA